MKKIKITLALLIVACMGIFSSLSAQQALRVYKHDGSMEVFFYSNLDSITFSNVDDAGVTQDFVVSQIFHTSDSTYQIPVNEIDSVAFSPIPTVYKSNAVRIDGHLRDYVLGSDSLTLYLKKSIPDNLLPKVGDNIATLECDDVLPYGFFGKVEKITHEASSINVECTQASLIDIFDSLGLEGTATSESPSSKSSRSPYDVWPPRHFNLTLPSLKASANIGSELDSGVGLSGTYDMSSSAEFSTEKCDVYWAFFITPMAFQLPQVYYTLTYTAQNTLSIEASLSASVKWKKEFPIEAIRNIRIPGAAAVFEFFEEVGVFTEIEGNMGLNSSIKKPFTTILHFSYDNKSKSSIPPTFKMIGRDVVSETTLEGEAAISVGLYGTLGVAPLVKEMADIEATLKAGAKFSSSLSLTPAPTPLEILNTEMFDEMDRDDFFHGDFTLMGEVEAKILNDRKLSGELEIGDLLVKNPFLTRGIVPHFDEVSLTESDYAGVLSARAKLSRQLMFDTPVGFALYDANKNLVDKWWSPTEYKDREGTAISHDFKGLSPNKEYILHPITRAFNDNMVANPSSKGKFTLNVVTGEATDITDQSAVLNGGVLGMKEGASIKVGFEYRSGNHNSWETIEALSPSENDRFNVVLNELIKETAYQYRAFVEMEGERIYGDIISFTTLAPVVIPTLNVKTEEATNISSNSAVLNGTVSGMNKGDLIKVGFEYRADNNDLWKTVNAVSTSEDGKFNVVLNGLSNNTVYHYRAFIEIDEEKEYGDILHFTTLNQNVQIKTQGVTFIKAQKTATYFDDGEYVNELLITINITGSDSIESLKPILYINGGETYFPVSIPFTGDGEITFEMETADSDEDFTPHSMGIDAFMKDGKIQPSSNMLQFSGSASSLRLDIVDNPNKDKVK